MGAYFKSQLYDPSGYFLGIGQFDPNLPSFSTVCDISMYFLTLQPANYFRAPREGGGSLIEKGT